MSSTKTRTKSTRQRIREPTEQSLGYLKGKPKENVSSPGYRLVQAIADRIDGVEARDQEGLKDARAIRSGVSCLTETQFILTNALRVVQEEMAKREVAMASN